ncbi:hypothetical protein [Tolypothrix sp. NIES-4075]|uniref:hypothetical protein n=1 Tax=Tolypothrix sp. NIES-4075 TaxID=2005459 RepID=UPI0013573ECD|nr:hypothetical protein [Tolypothrix sp. NIES-4075]
MFLDRASSSQLQRIYKVTTKKGLLIFIGEMKRSRRSLNCVGDFLYLKLKSQKTANTTR